MSDFQKCDVCGNGIVQPDGGEWPFPPDLCGECYAAGLKWMARQARAKAAGVCPKCGKVHPPAMPAGFQMPARCGRPDCPVCNPNAVVEKSP